MISTPVRAGAVSASLVSRHVRDTDSVLSGLPMRTGFPPAALPLFGQDQWDVTPAVFRENARRCHCSVDFAQLFDPAQRLAAKEYLYARLREPAGGVRPRLAPASVRAVFNRLRRFMTFAESRRGQFRLELLDQGDLDAWLTQLRAGGARAPHQVAALLDIPADLHVHADQLSQGGFTFMPWRGRPVSQVAGCPPVCRENATPRIPEPVIAALLRWSLRYIDDFASDILAARATLDQLEARARKIDVHKTHGARPVVTVVAERLDTFIAGRRAAGRGIPVWSNDTRVFNTIDPVPINYALIGLHLGCNAGDISQKTRNHARVLDAVRELGAETGGMEPPISAATIAPYNGYGKYVPIRTSDTI